MKLYNVKWGPGGTSYNSHICETLEAAQTLTATVLTLWGNIGDIVEITELEVSAVRTISKKQITLIPL